MNLSRKLTKLIRSYEDQILNSIVILSLITRYLVVVVVLLAIPLDTPMTAQNEAIGRVTATIMLVLAMGIFDYTLDRRI